MTAGDSAALECTVSGSPDLKVKWFKDGKEIISGRKYKMTLKDNIATLKILTAEKGDTSEYKMEVANKVGKDQCTCSVTVLGWLLVSATSEISFVLAVCVYTENTLYSYILGNALCYSPKMLRVQCYLLLDFCSVVPVSVKLQINDFSSLTSRSDNASSFHQVAEKS